MSTNNRTRRRGRGNPSTSQQVAGTRRNQGANEARTRAVRNHAPRNQGNNNNNGTNQNNGNNNARNANARGPTFTSDESIGMQLITISLFVLKKMILLNRTMLCCGGNFAFRSKSMALCR
jgi:hypothetical protein